MGGDPAISLRDLQSAVINSNSNLAVKQRKFDTLLYDFNSQGSLIVFVEC